MIEITLVDDHVWLRLTAPHYLDPFDMSFAEERGGRWNPPASWPTLYLNYDLATAHAQVRHLFADRGIDPDDLDDAAPIHLAAARLPQRQQVADVESEHGVRGAGLPADYPLDADGNLVDHATTQAVGFAVKTAGLHGVWCRSATLVGHELAWFPADGATARPAWAHTKPFARWRHAVTLDDIE